MLTKTCGNVKYFLPHDCYKKKKTEKNIKQVLYEICTNNRFYRKHCGKMSAVFFVFIRYYGDKVEVKVYILYVLCRVSISVAKLIKIDQEVQEVPEL